MVSGDSYWYWHMIEHPKARNHMNQGYNSARSLQIQALDDNYEIILNLGSGTFGKVVLARSLRPKDYLRLYNSHMYGTLLHPQPSINSDRSPLVAIKILHKESNNLQEYTRNKELKLILSIPSHPNLVQVYEVFIDPQGYHLHIVMESMNQTLFQVIACRKDVKFSHKTMKSILSQILNGIKHIHKFDFFHRDIKPENVLVIPTIQYYGQKENIPLCHKDDNYIVKVSDYGLSRGVDNFRPYTSYISTRWYRSPEILLRRKWHSKPVDIWAFGVLAVELINFEPLFAGKTEVDQLYKIFIKLGCPSLPSVNSFPYYTNTNYFIPLGGFWREAVTLGANIGIEFPYERGCTMTEIIPPLYKGLDDVIKACLTWDPDIRADVTYLSSLEYFKDSVVYEPCQPLKSLVPSQVKNINYFYDDFDDGYEKQFMDFDDLQENIHTPTYNVHGDGTGNGNGHGHGNLDYDNNVNNYSWKPSSIEPSSLFHPPINDMQTSNIETSGAYHPEMFAIK